MNKYLLGALIGLLFACKTQQVSIANTEWKLVKIENQEVASFDPPITLSFDEKQMKVNGFAGCNRFFGTYQSEGSKITFSGLGSTKMFCQDKMDVEDNYFKALGMVQSFKFAEDRLTMLADNQLILEFRK